MEDFKRLVKNMAWVEWLVCVVYITREICHFSLYYFEAFVMSLKNRVRWNDEGTSDVKAPTISIFNYHGHTSRICRERYLSKEELK